jgi:CheY-like chemotaxis protein
MPDKKRLLVVDDEEDFCLLLKDAMEEIGGYKVDYTTDPFQAEAKIAALRPDLILLDNVMPKRSGDEVAKAIKTNAGTKDIPIVMVSGRGEMVYIKRKSTFKWLPNTKVVDGRGEISNERSPDALAKVYHVDDYVSKPVSVETLISIIEDILS